MDFSFSDSDFGVYFMLGGVLAFVVTAIVHIAFAGGVAKACGLERYQGRNTVFVPPPIWILASLIGGVPIAAIFWALHYSSLRRLEALS